MTEQQPYAVVGDYDGFELRSYPEHLVAEVTTTGPFEDAGNRAFRYLFAYISGENSVRQKVAMTAPVVQAEASTKIAMTAPVVQEALGGKPGDRDGKGMFRVAFVLPAGLTIDTAPQPTSQEVQLRSVPGSLTAAVRYRGRWDEAGYARHLDLLRGAIAASGFTARGEPRFARFDPPFMPSFLRRNEVMLDIVPTEVETRP
ncbi:MULTISPECIES: heme-binding protein [unclassified Cryobacterium]|uniref:SOUL family heme-binding protein n=1 Tax=unclassified Cryobacterium TaxID=2649013 RepID=UPI002AB5674B|nr:MULTISPECIES: heme-binding protein [unclassified Cryobacterium]MDY7541315.1 heme-binding protein [Cryobacterium sp. 5B3]MEA9998115.1 heme-binding protein [Cryobacterium sp. RTS3]MEB0265305.1 heme-binding protein [Cryobacterium sp. 10I5]MEB0273386.1 heme-binding protein [Cryobacterium sp. 5B3]